MEVAQRLLLSALISILAILLTRTAVLKPESVPQGLTNVHPPSLANPDMSCVNLDLALKPWRLALNPSLVL